MGFHGFHIHSGEECSGNSDDLFANAKVHYNPSGSAHPNHAGDLPVLINNNGFALSIFITDRFTVEEIIGKTVIIHEKADDFTTQPQEIQVKKLPVAKLLFYKFFSVMQLTLSKICKQLSVACRFCKTHVYCI